MTKAYFNFMMALSVIFIISCNQQNHDKKNNAVIKKAEINVLTQFSLNYNKNLVCDSNSLVYYISTNFDTSFVLHIVKQDSLLYGVCYFVPSINKKGILDNNSRRSFLFNGFNFILDEEEWRDIKTEYRNLNFLSDKKVCLDCSFMFTSTEGNIKSGYLTENNTFGIFILNKIIHPRLGSVSK